MTWTGNIYAWTVAHKEGLPVMAAVASPFVAAAVGLFISNRQLKASREQIRFQRQHAEATLHGSYNQRWADRFLEKAAEFIANALETQSIAGSRTPVENLSIDSIDNLIRLEKEGVILRNEVTLMLDENSFSEVFLRQVASVAKIKGHNVHDVSETHSVAIRFARLIINDRLDRVNRSFLFDNKL